MSCTRRRAPRWQARTPAGWPPGRAPGPGASAPRARRPAAPPPPPRSPRARPAAAHRRRPPPARPAGGARSAGVRQAARRTCAAHASAPLPAHGGRRAARGGPRHAGLPLGAGAHQPRRAPGDEAQAPVDGRVLGRPRALGRAAGRGAACGARRTRHARSRLWRSSVRSQGLRGSEPGPLVCQARSTGSLPSRTPPAHEERTRHITNSLLVCLSELHAAAQARAPGGQRGARPPPCCHSQAAPSAPGAAASARLPRPAAEPVAGAAVTRRRPAHRLARLPGLPRRRPPAAALLRL